MPLPSASEIKTRLEQASTWAREAGQITLRYFQRSDLQVELKSDSSPVTVADREAEQWIRDAISESFPEDGILGEEFPEKEGESGFRWIVDPIDGTKSFIHGVPLYGTLIGIESGGESVLGVIHMPALDEQVYAGKGLGAWYVAPGAKPTPARVSSVESLESGLLCVTDVASFAQAGRGTAFERLQERARLCRTWGDCYGYLLVATGRAELMVDPAMSVWDAAALLPVLEEAGGTFTDWRGNSTIHGGEGIGSNGRVLPEVLQLIEAALQ